MASELRVNTITSTTGVGTVTLGSGGVSFSGTPTFNDVTLSSINGNAISGTRNRIINGDMRIDQRNVGASVTPNNSYTLDRWKGATSQTSKYTVQQSSTAPTGFKNSLLVTSSSAYSLTSSDYFAVGQSIEGFNIADLGWGAAGASSVTISFWVRSSLTGSFGGSLRNSSYNRSYPFIYTISSVNTFEYKTVTVSGDTTGTWSSDNSSGIEVLFGLGVGSTFSGTAGAWAGANYISATGATSVVGTSGATFYLTGVQLEPGTVATPFERRSYGQELALCQRYCHVTYYSATNPIVFWGYWSTSTFFEAVTTFPVTMRTTPTLTIPTIGSLYALEAQIDWRQISSFSTNESGPNCAKYSFTAATNTSFIKGQGGAIGIRAAGTVQFSSEI